MSKIIAWTSLAVDTRTSTVYSVAGGGHQDYSGNEADALSLATGNPAWRRLRAPSSSVANAEYYPDGRPTSRHHYYGVLVNESNGRVMVLGGSRWESGSGLDTVDSFDLAANDYLPPGAHPKIPNSVGQLQRAICRDPRNDDIYVFANYSVARWNRASNSWTTLISGSAPYFANNGTAFDTKRNVIHILVGNGQNYEYDVARNTFVTRRLTGANITPVSGMTLAYVPALDAFLARVSGAQGGAVMRIDAATFNVTSFQTFGGEAIPSTMNGPYNKFLYVPQLQGFVYVPSHTSDAWFLRVH